MRVYTGIQKNMKPRTITLIVAVLFAAGVLSSPLKTNFANAVVTCVDKYHYASVIPCSDQNAMIAPSGGNMTANTTNAGTNAARSFPNATIGNVNFLTYTNDTYGLKIQYPSNWLKEESHNQTSNDIVKFSAPAKAAPASLNIIGGKPAPQSIPLQTYISASINLLSQSFKNFNLIDSNATTLGDSPAQKIVYTAIPASGIELKFMQIFTIKDSKSYVITFGTLPIDFSRYLLTVQKMIDSFAFTSVITNASNVTTSTTDSITGDTPFQDLGSNIPVISKVIGDKQTNVYHNEKGVFVPWSLICSYSQSSLLESCNTLIGSDGSLTSEGDKAFGCIQTGFAIAAGAHSMFGLSPDVIGRLFGFAAPLL